VSHCEASWKLALIAMLCIFSNTCQMSHVHLLESSRAEASQCSASLRTFLDHNVATSIWSLPYKILVPDCVAGASLQLHLCFIAVDSVSRHLRYGMCPVTFSVKAGFLLQVFMVSSRRIQERNYETLFRWLTQSNKINLIGRVVLSVPPMWQVGPARCPLSVLQVSHLGNIH